MPTKPVRIEDLSYQRLEELAKREGITINDLLSRAAMRYDPQQQQREKALQDKLEALERELANVQQMLAAKDRDQAKYRKLLEDAQEAVAKEPPKPRKPRAPKFPTEVELSGTPITVYDQGVAIAEYTPGEYETPETIVENIRSDPEIQKAREKWRKFREYGEDEPTPAPPTPPRPPPVILFDQSDAAKEIEDALRKVKL